MSNLYIGLMSGTSLDGIDAALVDFSQSTPRLLASINYELKPAIRSSILSLRQPGDNEIHRLCELDVILGQEFASAVNTLLKQQQLPITAINAIGSHGQTIRHQPQQPFPFTLQIGDPNIIAAKTGITTVADFRRRDVAHGGQGAPLVPAFHRAIFNTAQNNLTVVNIGGIANISLLPKNASFILGFDTGPGNTLIDAWADKYLHQSYDKNGEWAAQGTIHQPLLKRLLNDAYFKLPAPKSTGQEYFNLHWLSRYLPDDFKPVDVQATLVELTAQSIVNAMSEHLKDGEMLICGGGAHNLFLLSRLRALASGYSVDTTNKYGIDPDWIEAMAFAWLAKQTMDKKPANLQQVTGASCEAILGGVYFG